jgi:hypothetical protein
MYNDPYSIMIFLIYINKKKVKRRKKNYTFLSQNYTMEALIEDIDWVYDSIRLRQGTKRQLSYHISF